MKNRPQSGFTLIELLVVVAVIGMLMSIVVLSLGHSRMKSRDAKRLSDVNQIRTGLELYFNQAAGYPGMDIWNSGLLSCGAEKLMDVPRDPITFNFYGYMVQDMRGTACGGNVYKDYYVMFTTEGDTELGPGGTYYWSEKGYTSSAPF